MKEANLAERLLTIQYDMNYQFALKSDKVKGIVICSHRKNMQRRRKMVEKVLIQMRLIPRNMYLIYGMNGNWMKVDLRLLLSDKRKKSV